MPDTIASCRIRCEQLPENGQALQAAVREVTTLGAEEVLLEVDHCGVCHSDLHLQDGYFDLGEGARLDVSSQRSLPLTLGHEVAGRVIATGSNAPGELQGRFVAVYPWIGCGACGLCERGDEHLCDRPQAIGINVNGGYASHLVVPHARYLLDLEGIATRNAGCLMCSGLTAFSALRKAERFLAAGPLLIIGLGGVGMMGLRFAKATHTGPVFVADTNARTRETALEMGADTAFDPADPDARKSVKSATHGGAGAIVDFVGAGQSLTFAQRVAAKGAGIVVVGLMGGSYSTPVPMLPFTSITIQGSYVGSLAEAREMLDLVRTGTVHEIPVQDRPLSEASQALDALRNGNVVGRIVLRP